MSAPLGNQYAVKAKRWSQAIDNALAKRSRGEGIVALDDLAEKLLVACDEGDVSALRELGDRIEGKPAQTIQGPDGASVFDAIRVTIVKPE